MNPTDDDTQDDDHERKGRDGHAETADAFARGGGLGLARFPVGKSGFAESLCEDPGVAGF